MENREKLVVSSEYRLLPGKMEDFLVFAHADAAASVANEPGCLAFDVLGPEGNNLIIIFHEVYRGHVGFEAHKLTQHYATFKSSAGPLMNGDPTIRMMKQYF